MRLTVDQVDEVRVLKPGPREYGVMANNTDSKPVDEGSNPSAPASSNLINI